MIYVSSESIYKTIQVQLKVTTNLTELVLFLHNI